MLAEEVLACWLGKAPPAGGEASLAEETPGAQVRGAVPPCIDRPHAARNRPRGLWVSGLGLFTVQSCSGQAPLRVSPHSFPLPRSRMRLEGGNWAGGGAARAPAVAPDRERRTARSSTPARRHAPRLPQEACMKRQRVGSFTSSDQSSTLVELSGPLVDDSPADSGRLPPPRALPRAATPSAKPAPRAALPWQASYLLDYVQRCLDALIAMHRQCGAIQSETRAAEMAVVLFRCGRAPRARAQPPPGRRRRQRSHPCILYAYLLPFEKQNRLCRAVLPCPSGPPAGRSTCGAPCTSAPRCCARATWRSRCWPRRCGSP